MDTIRTSVGDDGGGECDPVSAPPRCHNYYALQHLLKHHLQRFDLVLRAHVVDHLLAIDADLGRRA